MRILEEVNKETRCWPFVCEVHGCKNIANYKVTDDTPDGEGYICKSCNDKDEIEKKGWE